MNSSVGAVARSMRSRKPYPSDIPDEERDFVAPRVASVGDTKRGIRLEVAEHPEARRGLAPFQRR